jgi:hypothetical protein
LSAQFSVISFVLYSLLTSVEDLNSIGFELVAYIGLRVAEALDDRLFRESNWPNSQNIASIEDEIALASVI